MIYGKDIPFDADEEKSKKTLYKIADPFVDFHYRFVVPMRSFIELDVVAESLDKKKILIGECKWTSGENAVALEKELRWKASMLPFAKGKEVVPVIFTKNVTHQTDTAIVISPKDIMDLMK